jgi:CRP/FNR family cyclic AMP-dependent transcriptional regulator
LCDRHKSVEPSEKNLYGIESFEGLDKPEFVELAAASRWLRFSRHQQIIDKNSESRDIYIVVEGGRIVNYSLGGREITLDDLPKGLFFV